MQITQPHNADIERNLLSCLICDQSVFDDIGELNENHFYSPRCVEIFAAIKNLRKSGSAIDLSILRNELQRNGGKYDYYEFLIGLTDHLPEIKSAQTYAKTLRDLAHRRSIIKACMDSIQTASDASIDHNSMVETVASNMDVVTQNETADTCVTVEEALTEAVGKIKDAHAGTSEAASTGLSKLDDVLGGIWPGELVIIAGRPSMGKSALGMDIAKAVASKGLPSIFFSLEMSRYLLSLRILSSETKLDSKRLRGGYVGESCFEDLDNVITVYRDVPWLLDCQSRLTVDKIRSVCAVKRRRYGKLGLVVVDYIQLMRTSNKVGNREQEVAAISAGLKGIATEFCPVVALAQLNRGLEYRNDKRPTISDLRESGAIEQDADTVLLLYRDDYYNPESEDAGIAEIKIGKHRSGPTGTVKVRFLRETTTFKNLEERDEYEGNYYETGNDY